MYMAFCAVCYFLCRHMPRASRECYPLMLRLLPYAGEWAYRDEPKQEFGHGVCQAPD